MKKSYTQASVQPKPDLGIGFKLGEYNLENETKSSKIIFGCEFGFRAPLCGTVWKKNSSAYIEEINVKQPVVK